MRRITLVYVIIIMTIIISGFGKPAFTQNLGNSAEPSRVWYRTWNDYSGEYLYSSVFYNDTLIAVGWGHNKEDALVIAYDSHGNLEWYRYINWNSSYSEEKLRSVCVDDDGNIFAVGTAAGDTLDIIMVKIDLSGGVIWKKVYDSGGKDVGVYVNFDRNDSTYIITGNYNDDTYLWKFGKDGSFIWAKNIAPENYDYDTGCYISVTRDYYVIEGYGDHPDQKDVFIEVVYPNGTVKNSFSIGDSSDDDRTRGIVVAGGYIYAVTGLNFGRDGSDIYKLTFDGTVVWKKSINMGYITRVNIGYRNGDILIGGYVVENNGDAHVLLGEINPSGDAIWWMNDTITSSDYINHISVENYNSFYLVGNTTNPDDGTSDALTVRYLWDSTPPVVDIISPSNESYLNNSNIEVKWTGSDDYGIDHYEISDGGENWINVGVNTSYEFSNLKDGTHLIYVKAVDEANNTSIVYIEITVDTEAPVIKINYPLDNSLLNSSYVNISWAVSDSTPIRYVKMEVDDNDYMEINISGYIKLKMDDGQHTIKIWAEDSAGNIGHTSTNFIVDTAPPYLEITGPKDGIFSNRTQIFIIWEDWDENGIKACMIKIDDGPWRSIRDIGKYLLTLNEGTHRIELMVLDDAGNKEVKYVNITVDTTPPSLEIQPVTQDGNRITIKWKSTDAVSGVDHYMIKIDDESWRNLTGNKTTIEGLKPGKHIVYIRAYDKAGNYVESAREFEVKSFAWLWILIGAIAVSIILLILYIRRRKGSAGDEKT